MKRESANEAAARIDRMLAEAREHSSVLLCDRITSLAMRGIASAAQAMEAQMLREKILKARGET